MRKINGESRLFKQRKLFTLFTGLALVALVGCTRDVPKVDTHFTISIPAGGLKKAGGVGSLVATTSAARFILINVSGSDMPKPVVFQWSQYGGYNVINTLPPYFTIPNVPVGNSRLFQVLWVETDSATGGMNFYYGDAFTKIDDATTSVNVNLDDLPINSAGVGDGMIAGRKLTTPTTGPTSEIGIYFQPPRGPKMLVETGEVVNGWFRVFALQGMTMSYLMEDGSEFFGAPVSVNDVYGTPAQAATRMEVHLPTYYHYEGGSPMDPSPRYDIEFASNTIADVTGAGKHFVLAGGTHHIYYEVTGGGTETAPVIGGSTAHVVTIASGATAAQIAAATATVISTITGLQATTVGTAAPYTRVRVVHDQTAASPIAYSPAAGDVDAGVVINNSREINAPTKIVVGWFGADANIAGKKMCYNSVASANIPYSFAAATGTTEVIWNSSTGAASTTAHPLVGGVGASLGGDNECVPSPMTTSDKYVNYISLAHERVMSHDSAMSFKAPFQPVQMSMGGGNWPMYLNFNYSAGTGSVAMSWKFLPGIYSNNAASPVVRGVDGVDVYMRILADTSSSDNLIENYKDSDDRILCDRLTALGFTLAVADHPVPGGATVADSVNYVVPNTGIFANFESAMSEGRAQVIVCPYGTVGWAGKHYYKGALEYQNYGGWGGGGPSMASSFEIVMPNGQSTATIANGVCTPFVVMGKNSNGGRAQFEPGTMLYLSHTGSGSVSFYDQNNCTTPIASSVSVYGGDMRRLFMKNTFSGAGSGSITVGNAPSVPTVSGSSGTLTYADVPGTPTYVLKARVMPGPFRTYQCVPLTLEMWHDDGTTKMLIPYGSTQGFSATLTSAFAGFNFYDEYDWACNGAAFGFSAPTTTGAFAFSTSTSFATKNVLLSNLSQTSFSLSLAPTPAFSGTYAAANTAANSPLTVTGSTVTIQVTRPGSFHHLSMWMPMNVQVNNCSPVELHLEDSYGNLASYSTTSSLLLNLSAGASGSFYTAQNCGSGATTTLTFAAGEARKVLFYKNTTTGNVSVSATASANSSITSSQQVTVGP